MALILDERGVPLQSWILNSEDYAGDVTAYRRNVGLALTLLRESPRY